MDEDARLTDIDTDIDIYMDMDMGWLRLVGSTKLQVSFAEHSPFNRSHLQNRPMILSILQTEATRYASLDIDI